jgi:D-aspartate ligase
MNQTNTPLEEKMQSARRDDFKVLLFASDINVYSVARAFHEAFDIIVDAFGKADSGPCIGSKIVRYTYHPAADTQKIFLEKVLEFAQQYQDKKVIVLGCGDNYLELISENKPHYPKNVIAPYIDIDFLHTLIHKEKFYELCEQYGVDYPATFIHRPEMTLTPTLPFDAPYILKPSNGVEYWQHPFPGQNKAFKANTYEEMQRILQDVYDSGYPDSMIIQDFIPGDDTFMRVLTNYSDRGAKVKMMCLGHVLLEEHTPHGIGNHAVIITEPDLTFTDSIKGLLEKIGYVGFSNLDIKYDQRDGKYKVFEINPRQGRSNFYVTGSGCNIAELLVKDLIDGEPLTYQSVETENLWLVIPRRVAFRYIKPKQYKAKMKELIAVGKVVNPLLYRPDMGLGRSFRTFKSIMSHYAKFKKYLGNQ